MTTARTGTVYVLIDPRDNRVRYVGATTQALDVRLRGHYGRAARRVKTWLDELSAEGLTAQIAPVMEHVPVTDLPGVERAEITRRLVAGETLLNESATALARRQIERQREQDRIARRRVAWERAARQARAIVGGPLAPGDVPPIPLPPAVVSAYRTVSQIQDSPEPKAADDPNLRLSRSTRLMIAQERAGEIAWKALRPAWSRLCGRSGPCLEEVLKVKVCTLFKTRWASLEDVSQYLGLLAWALIAVGPWAALAEQAGLDARGDSFIDWVSSDHAVRAALAAVLPHAGPLSIVEDQGSFTRPSAGLVVMTAAHRPAFDLPKELHMDVEVFLEVMLRRRQFTPAMGGLLLRLDPAALDRLLGHDITPGIDARLGLPPGTSAGVLAAVLEVSDRDLDGLTQIVNRAKGAFPAVVALDYADRYGETVPMFQAVTASLAKAGLLKAPREKTPDQLVDEVRTLWCADLRRLEQAA